MLREQGLELTRAGSESGSRLSSLDPDVSGVAGFHVEIQRPGCFHLVAVPSLGCYPCPCGCSWDTLPLVLAPRNQKRAEVELFSLLAFIPFGENLLATAGCKGGWEM